MENSREFLEKNERLSEEDVEQEGKVIINKNINVFIDDDKLMHLIWEHEAKKSKIQLRTYFSVEEFFEKYTEVPKTARIFIDSDLGESIKGELEAEKLYKAGYKDLYLATGYLEEDIIVPHWIKKVVGKKPEFFVGC